MRFWKALEPLEANGVILRYEVTVRAKSPPFHSPWKYNVNTTSLTLKLSNRTYEVTVIAYNRVGASPPSVLLIPTSNSKGSCPSNVLNLQMHGIIASAWLFLEEILSGVKLHFLLKHNYTVEWISTLIPFNYATTCMLRSMQTSVFMDLFEALCAISLFF